MADHQSPLSLLPQSLAAQSLSPREIVLPYGAALEAVAILERAGVVVLGWDGWIRYPDGGLGGSARQQGTESCEQEVGESRDAWVHRAAEFARSTIRMSQAEWTQQPEVPGGTLLFCITPEAGT